VQARAARAVLWDLDGTLVDSAQQHWEAWRETLEARGLSITPAQFRATFGRRNDAILAGWLGADQPAALVREIGDAKEARYRELVAGGGLAPLPGAMAWVERLAQGGWRQAVASAAPRANVDVVVKTLGIEGRFGALVGAEDVRHGKPDPEVFLVAAARLGVPASRCVVVEDAAPGIEAARRAGMRCIGVGPADLGRADLVAGSLTDLAADAYDRLLTDVQP
jgi:HAD superfamily hydrolase (TIGR01509 family)